MDACIYGLCDPETLELRYIGKANNPKSRLASHLRDARRRVTPVYRWIRKLSQSGKRPEMVILRDGCKDWVAAERACISKARSQGLRLLNVADGGDQPYCPDEILVSNGMALNNPATKAYRHCLKALARAEREAAKGGNIQRASRFSSVASVLRGLNRKQKLEFSRRFEKLHAWASYGR